MSVVLSALIKGIVGKGCGSKTVDAAEAGSALQNTAVRGDP